MPVNTTTATTVSITKSLAYFPFVGFCMSICDTLYMDCNLLSFLTTLMFLDFISGWYKSFQLNIPITKARLFAGLYAKVTIFVILVAIGIVIASVEIVSHKVFIFFSMEDYMSSIILFMILNEAYSIFGNFIAGRQKEEIKEVDFITLVMRKVRDMWEKKLTKDINKIEG